MEEEEEDADPEEREEEEHAKPEEEEEAEEEKEEQEVEREEGEEEQGNRRRRRRSRRREEARIINVLVGGSRKRLPQSPQKNGGEVGIEEARWLLGIEDARWGSRGPAEPFEECCPGGEGSRGSAAFVVAMQRKARKRRMDREGRSKSRSGSPPIGVLPACDKRGSRRSRRSRSRSRKHQELLRPLEDYQPPQPQPRPQAPGVASDLYFSLWQASARKAMDLVALRGAMRAQLTTEAETEEEMEQEQKEENGEEEEAVPTALESKVTRLCNEVAEDSKAAEEIEEAMKEDKKKEDSKAAEEIEEAMKDNNKKKEEEEVKIYIGAWERLADAQLLATNVHPRW